METPTAQKPAHGTLAGPSLSTLGVVGQAMAIGPIFSAGVLLGTVAAFAGFTTPLAVLFATIGTFGMVYVLIRFGRRYAGAGSMYEYLTRGVHSSVGIIGAGTYLFGLLFLGAGGAYVTEGYLTQTFFQTTLSVDVTWWVWSIVALAIALVVNYLGVRIGVRMILSLAVISSIIFIVISVAVIVKGGADGNTLSAFDPSKTSWNSVFHGILLAVTLYIGFESAAALGEEARLPRRSIPIAMFAAVAVSAAFYLLTSYAGAIGFGQAALDKNAWFSSVNPYGELGARYLGVHALNWIVNLMIILDLLSVIVAFTLAASRLLMVLARDGLLPRPIMRTDARFRTPVGGLAVLAVWAGAILLWASLTHYGKAAGLPDVLQAFLIVNATGSYLITLVYLFLAVGVLRIVWEERAGGGLWWQVPVVIVGGAMPILAFDGSLNPFPAYPNDVAVYFALVFFGVSIAWYVLLRVFRPGVVHTAARHAVGSAPAEPGQPVDVYPASTGVLEP